MTLTDDQLRQGCFEAIKEYTNNFRDITELANAPLSVQLAVEKMLEYSSRDGTVKSESIADLSTTYRDLTGLPQDVLNLINPYCKVRF